MHSSVRSKPQAPVFFSIFSTAALVLLAGAGILVFPGAAGDGARNGLSFCGEILIPSIFPFMVLSSFVVKSGLSNAISKMLDPITRRLFCLPGCTGATIVIGMIGGYPAGARGIKALLERGEISPSQAERMLSFSVGAGPAFVITVVGSGLLGSSQSGLILFASQCIAAILIGILSGFLARRKGETCEKGGRSPAQKCDISTALVESSADSTSGMINMCAFVVLFSAVLNIIIQSGLGDAITGFLMALGVPQSTAASLIPILLEVTSGCTNAANLGASPFLISFALGWAGACVHFQISASLTNVTFSRMKFTFYRLLHGLFAAAVSYLGFSLFPEAAEVLSTTAKPLSAGFAATASGSVMLILVCALFVLSITPKKLDFPRKR